ncbi:MAG: iron-sulfur cluster insertion protein ErpA [Gammaproteobacteria bacterium]|jgi:iron-sulfur cluster insertion protein|nr:iron-sulfur cluster insertion protein ErpA [Gammaproteobacteria bacterium]
MSSIQLTDNAHQKIHQLISDEKSHPDELLYLRISIVGGGCSGFQYDFEFCEEIEQDDISLDFTTFQLIIDPISIQVLAGATIDYIMDMNAERFTIKNPHAKSTCGCGNSFSLDT